MTRDAPTHLDLFSGIGGFALAARWAGLETIAFCENDPYCKKVLRKHWPDVPIHDDITRLDGNQFKDIFLITGGFPCQDISIAGKGAGIDGERSGLWTELHRIIGEVRPRFALVENVPALTFRGGTRVIADLTSIGYDTEWQIVGADDVGAPHRRKRIWIVAHSESDRVFSTTQKHFQNRPGENEKERQAQSCNPSSSPTDVAYSGCTRVHERRQSNDAEGEDQRPGRVGPDGIPERQVIEGEALADSKSAGLQTCSSNRVGTEHGARRDERQFAGASGTPEDRSRGRWLPEPNVGRVAHGIPSRVDRLRGLGNAIVPQVAYEIILAMLK